jgi:hypothetical protein
MMLIGCILDGSSPQPLSLFSVDLFEFLVAELADIFAIPLKYDAAFSQADHP